MGRAERIAAYLEECIARGDFPGAVALVVEQDRAVACVASGHAVVEPEKIAATLDTVFDLASLTKPLCTALLVAQLIEAGRLSLDAPASTELAELRRPDKHGITVRQLLTHTSGLPKWRPFYVDPGEAARIAEAIAQLPLEHAPASHVIYSDPGTIALGLLLERVLGARLDVLFESRIAEPLGLARTRFRPPAAWRRGIAASERGNAVERTLAGTAAERAPVAFRTELIWGEVHDNNAHFLGGVAGHAGLFGPAAEVARIASQFLPGSALLRRRETLDSFRRNMTPGLEEHRSLGWMLASSPGSSASTALPPDAFGHTGFTGTSVWIDPHAARIIVLLTNRTHPSCGAAPMLEIRRRVNELASEPG